VEISSDVVCLGLIDKYNTLAAIHSRHGEKWNFKCLGEAIWVVTGHCKVIVNVEGIPIPSASWTIENVTIVRACLTHYQDVLPVDKMFWEVELMKC